MTNVRSLLKIKWMGRSYSYMEVSLYHPNLENNIEFIFNYKIGNNLTLTDVELIDNPLKWISDDQLIDNVKELVSKLLNSSSKENIKHLTDERYGYASKENCGLYYSNNTVIGYSEGYTLFIYPDGF